MEPLAVAVAEPVQVQPAFTVVALTTIGVIGVQPLLNWFMYAWLAALFGEPGVWLVVAEAEVQLTCCCGSVPLKK